MKFFYIAEQSLVSPLKYTAKSEFFRVMKLVIKHLPVTMSSRIGMTSISQLCLTDRRNKMTKFSIIQHSYTLSVHDNHKNYMHFCCRRFPDNENGDRHWSEEEPAVTNSQYEKNH